MHLLGGGKWASEVYRVWTHMNHLIMVNTREIFVLGGQAPFNCFRFINRRGT